MRVVVVLLLLLVVVLLLVLVEDAVMDVALIIATIYVCTLHQNAQLTARPAPV